MCLSYLQQVGLSESRWPSQSSYITLSYGRDAIRRDVGPGPGQPVQLLLLNMISEPRYVHTALSAAS